MSTRERSNERRISSASAAARSASSGADATGSTSPSVRTCSAPASSSRASALASFVWDRSRRVLQLVRGHGVPGAADGVEHLGELVDLDVAAGEEALQADVLGPVEEHDLGGLAVAPGAPGLLVVGVERLGDLGVVDPAHVVLVDAHPERGGGDDDADLAVHEALLDRVALVGLHPRVVGGGARDRLRERLGLTPRRDVDDPRRRRGRDPRLQRAQLALGAPLAVEALDREAQVRAIEPADQDRRGRAARAAPRSRRARAAPRSPSARAPAGGRAPRSPRPAAGTRAGSRGPIRRRSAPRRPRTARCPRPTARRSRRPAPAAPAPGTGTRACPRPARAARARARRLAIVEFSCAAPPAASSFNVSTWSRCSAISGETTIVAPGRQQPGDLVDRRLPRAGRHHDQRVVAGERGLDPLALARAQLGVAERLARDPVDPRFVGQEP